MGKVEDKASLKMSPRHSNGEIKDNNKNLSQYDMNPRHCRSKSATLPPESRGVDEYFLWALGGKGVVSPPPLGFLKLDVTFHMFIWRKKPN